MSFETMLRHAPVLVYLRQGKYHANWSPRVDGAPIHGRGIAETPYDAIARAYADARNQGWAP